MTLYAALILLGSSLGLFFLWKYSIQLRDWEKNGGDFSKTCFKRIDGLLCFIAFFSSFFSLLITVTIIGFCAYSLHTNHFMDKTSIMDGTAVILQNEELRKYVLVENDGAIKDTPFVFTRWDIKGGTLYDYAPRTYKIMLPMTITLPQGQVKILKYSLLIERFENIKDFVTLSPSDRANENHLKLIKSILYEMTEANKEELAKLYNPIRVDQQQLFEHIARKSLTELLASKGSRIATVEFQM